jgi:Divergent InlB B-repeat domain/Galactose oxidase, central domain/Kelch motif
MDYDSTASRVLLFGGGLTGAASEGVLSDTWAWDGVNWIQQFPAASPPARESLGMTYDAAHQTTVIFGGEDAQVDSLSDTWLFVNNPGPSLTVTVPAGVQYTFNNQTYTGTQTIVVASGAYTLSTASPQSTGTGTQAVFVSWSDGGAQSHTVTVGSSPVSVIGSFQSQYLLTTTASPTNGGVVIQTSGSGGGPYYNPGTLVSVTYTPSSGYNFTGWSGACSGSGGCFVTMNAPAAVTANFVQQTYAVTITVPAGIQYSLGGFPLTGTETISLPAGSYGLALNSPQSTGAGTQAAFVSWSDGGAQSHNIVVTNAAVNVTGTFKTQYLLTVVDNPTVGGGAFPVTVVASAPYYDAGTAVVLSPSPAAGYEFLYWGGVCSGSGSLCLVVMTAPMSVAAYFAASENWVPLFPAVSPSQRTLAAMAYDSARQETVLFGGQSISSILSDTWVWNGSTWTQKSPAVSPPAREAYAMAYDAARQKVVLFGGASGASTLSDTWVWDGNTATWTHMTPATSPPARAWHSMAYDAARQQVVLFGGESGNTVFSETWVWDGANWAQKAVSGPSGREAPWMTFDAARQQVVLFGGNTSLDINSKSTLLADTWVWNGAAWTQKTPAVSPSVRSQATMAYDANIEQVVLFAGYGGVFSNITWLWDGANWTQKFYAVSPDDRDGAMMAYDAARQQVVLFGGDEVQGFDNETWVYCNNLPIPPSYPLTLTVNPPGAGSVLALVSGQSGPSYFAGSTASVAAYANPGYGFEYFSGACTGVTCNVIVSGPTTVTANFGPPSKWIELFPATSPGYRLESRLVEDQARQQLVLFSGSSASGASADTWVWDGNNWTQKFPVNSPPARTEYSIAYDSARQQVVLFGGQGSAGHALADTWVWDGTNWTQKSPATSPPGRFCGGMAYDSVHQQIVLFGGTNYAGGTPYNVFADTWVWDGAKWTQKPAAGPAMRLGAAMAWDGARQRIVLFGGLSDVLSVNPAAPFYSDTWVWDGGVWTQMAPAASPPGHANSWIAYDPLIQQVVLFGGDRTSNVASSATWFWDGANWSQQTYAINPSDRELGPMMAYDSTRQQVVMFGGSSVPNGSSLTDTWVFANNIQPPRFTMTTAASPATGGAVAQSAPGQMGPTYIGGTQVQVTATPNPGYELESYSGACEGFSSCSVFMDSNKTVTANFGTPLKWVEEFPSSSPQPFGIGENVALAYDAARQQVVLFGAVVGGSPFGNQTWVWTGSNWTQKFPATVPPARYGQSVAWDQTNQQVVMFGGANAGGALSDTWVWDGVNWTQKAVGAVSPPPRLNHRMASDGQHVVLFGGWTGAFTGTYLYSDTWLWDGTSWTQPVLFAHPTGRSDFGMAYDPVRQRIFVFSGLEVGADTWMWEPGTPGSWFQLAPASAPPAGWNAMAFDAARQQTVLYVEVPNGPQTWIFDGINWVQRLTSVTPAKRYAAGMAYDAATQQTVLFGGTDYASGLPIADTWVWLPPSTNLTPGPPSIAKDAGGDYLVTVTLTNAGNVPLTSIQVNSAKLSSTTSAAFTTPVTVLNVPPGGVATFTAKFPPSTGTSGTAVPVTFSGIYSTGAVSNAPWTASARQITLP